MVISRQLQDSLLKLPDKHWYHRIVFTGHAIGGAIATLASVHILSMLSKLGYPNVTVSLQTFGCPITEQSK